MLIFPSSFPNAKYLNILSLYLESELKAVAVMNLFLVYRLGQF